MSENKTNVWAIIALVFGIMGVCIGWMPFVSMIGFFIIPPMLAVGIVAVVMASKNGFRHSMAMAIVSLVLIVVASGLTTCSSFVTAKAISDVSESEYSDLTYD